MAPFVMLIVKTPGKIFSKVFFFSFSNDDILMPFERDNHQDLQASIENSIASAQEKYSVELFCSESIFVCSAHKESSKLSFDLYFRHFF